MAPEPRVFAFSIERRIPHQEIPLSWLEQRYDRMPDAERALEIAPGVKIALMGTGDILLPDGDYCQGALIAVWADERDDEPPRCPRCEGCGQLADSEDREPWSAWLNLPLASSAAVLAGIVRPVPCDQCNGSGTVPAKDGADGQ